MYYKFKNLITYKLKNAGPGGIFSPPSRQACIYVGTKFKYEHFGICKICEFYDSIVQRKEFAHIHLLFLFYYSSAY